MDVHLPSENDLSTDDLFTMVFDELRDEDNERFGALIALQGRPTAAVINRSCALCGSDRPADRIVGLRVLRELKHPLVDRSRMWETIEPVVVRLVNDDPDPDVLSWAIACLGYQSGGIDSLSAVSAHAGHRDAAVRFAVAAALPSLIDLDPTGEALDLLVALTEDEDADVRSYALMGLVYDLDMAESMSEVVAARLEDDDEQVRRVAKEALRTLADD